MGSRVADALGALWRSKQAQVISSDEEDGGDVVDTANNTDAIDDDTDALQLHQAEAGPGPATQAQRRLLGRLSSTPGLPNTPQAPSQIYKCPQRDRPLYSVKGKAILVHATDADRAFWPTELAARPELPFWHTAVEDNDKRQATWRLRAGQVLARELNLDNPKDEWEIAAWPAGYKMFVQHSTANPDAFFVHVAGSSVFQRRRKFKTAKEFGKHLAWLCRYGDDISARCTCKHCLVVSKRRQDPQQRSMNPQQAPTTAQQQPKEPPRRSVVIRRVPMPPIVWPAPPPIARPKKLSTSKAPPTLLDQAKTLASNIGGAAKSTAKAILGAVTTAPVQAKVVVAHADSTETGPPAKAKKRKRRSTSTSEFEMRVGRDDVQPIDIDANGRPKRSTRYVKSMKDLTPPPKKKAKTPDPTEKKANPKPVAVPLAVWPGAFVNRERQADLDNAGGWMRKYELVWHKLEKPFVCRQKEKFIITHWPALVVERRIEIDSTVHVYLAGEADDTVPDPLVRVKQRAGCMVRLLATRGTIYSSYQQTLPYVAYTPHDLLNNDVHAYLCEYKDKPAFSDLSDWDEAITPWVLAKQIVGYIKESWCLVDPYWRPTEYDKLKRLMARSKTQSAENRARMDIAEHETAVQSIYWGCEKIWSGELVRLYASWGVAKDKRTAVLCLTDDQRIPLEYTSLSDEQMGKQVLFKISTIVRDPASKDVTLHGKFMQLVQLSELEIQEKRLQAQPDAAFQRVLGLEAHAYYREQYLPRATNLKEYRPVLRSNDEDHAMDEKIPIALLAGRHYPVKSYFVDMTSQFENYQARALAGRQFSRSSWTPATKWQPSREAALKAAYRRGRSDVQHFFLQSQITPTENGIMPETINGIEDSDDVVVTAGRS